MNLCRFNRPQFMSILCILACSCSAEAPTNNAGNLNGFEQPTGGEIAGASGGQINTNANISISGPLSPSDLVRTFDGGIDTGAGTDPEECASTGKTAETGLATVDIIWVVDGSQSMVDEAERVRDNMDRFVAEISASGVDTRVVLLAPQDLIPPTSNLAQSGNYLFVSANIDSNNSLDQLISNFAAYSGFLRPFAHVHFIVVTDDESRYKGLATPDTRASQFQADIDGMLEPEFSFHAIASEGAVGAPPCIPESIDPELARCCQEFLLLLFLALPPGCEPYQDQLNPLVCPFLGGAFAPGVTYYTLANNTAGVAVSICKEDWTEVFGSLRDAVIESAPLPCNYEIPEPPNGLLLATDKVNVKYTPQGVDPNSVLPYPREVRASASDATACGDSVAWYFDNEANPTEVLLCPAACSEVGSGKGGTVEVLFGCDTIILQ